MQTLHQSAASQLWQWGDLGAGSQTCNTLEGTATTRTVGNLTDLLDKLLDPGAIHKKQRTLTPRLTPPWLTGDRMISVLIANDNYE